MVEEDTAAVTNRQMDNVLGKEQIDFAYEQMKELHPLWVQPIYKPFPLLRPFAPCFRGYFPLWRTEEEQKVVDDARNAVNQPLLNNVPGHHGHHGDHEPTIMVGGKIVKLGVHKKKKKSHANEEVANADPLVRLGFGICAYRDIVWSMIWTFVIFSLIMIPQFKIYASGTAYNSLPNILKSSENLMLGNMGYSTVNCVSMPVEVGSYTFTCPYGVIGQITDFGVNNPGSGALFD